MNWSNIICIEIKKYNNQQLDVICEQLNFPLGSLIEFKDSGSTRLYWEKDKDKLLKIQPTDFKTKKNTKVFVESIKDSNKKVFSVKEVLETDAILDKIFKSGMNSLTMNEKKFLDDLSKS